MQLGKMRIKILKHAEIGMIEDVEQDVLQLVTGVRVDQMLYRHAVGEQKDDADQCEVDQLNKLQHIPQSYVLAVFTGNIIKLLRLLLR